jgi:hypothetical protein
LNNKVKLNLVLIGSPAIEYRLEPQGLAMPDVVRKPCPKCGRPMLVLLASDGKSRLSLKGQACDQIDPLTSPEARGWIESKSLKPPEEH